MKRITCFILVVSLLIYNPSYSQNKNNAAAGIAGAVAGGIAVGLLAAASIESVKEGMERNIVEWIYTKYELNTPMQFELKLIKWEATKKEDLSNVSVIGYKFSDFSKPPVVLLNACSPGWINDYGINFEQVKVYEIDQKYWAKLMLKYLNIIRSSNTPELTDIEKIPVIDKKGNNTVIPFYFLKSVSSTQAVFAKEGNDEYKFLFKTLGNGDVHIGTNFDEEFKIDFNEGNLNLFLKSTQDLVRIKRDFIVDITKSVFEDKIPRTVFSP